MECPKFLTGYMLPVNWNNARKNVFPLTNRDLSLKSVLVKRMKLPTACFVAVMCLFPLMGMAQQGYTASTGEAIWGVTGEHRDISLTPEGGITDGGDAFLLESLMPANPTNNSSNFRFDYKIKQHVKSPVYSGPIVYYVNSKDGSVAFTAEDNPQIRNRIRRDLGDFHFGIRKATGNILICGLYKNERTGTMEKRGVDLGKDSDVNALWGEMLWDQMTWLNTAEALSEEGLADALTPAQIDIIESASVEGMRGKVASGTGEGEQIIDFYFIPFPVLERVSVPFMGINSGIMKNYKKQVNQLVIYSVVRNVEWKGTRSNLHFYLDGLYRADAVFRPGEYRVMTAFNKAGTAEAGQLQSELMQLSQRIVQLNQLIADCPKGNAGKACREPYQRELKEIQQKIEEQSKEFIRKHNLD